MLRRVVAHCVKHGVGQIGLKAQNVRAGPRLRKDPPCASRNACRPSKSRPRPPGVHHDPRRCRRPGGNVSAIFAVLPAGSSAHSPTPVAVSIRTTPPCRTPRSRSRDHDLAGLDHGQGMRCAPHLRPSPTRRPTGGQTGATAEPMERPRPPTLSASALIPSSSTSIDVCGSARNRSTPSNLMPSTSAACGHVQHLVEAQSAVLLRPFRQAPATWRCAVLGKRSRPLSSSRCCTLDCRHGPGSRLQKQSFSDVRPSETSFRDAGCRGLCWPAILASGG